jgi:hypothetical protein
MVFHGNSRQILIFIVGLLLLSFGAFIFALLGGLLQFNSLDLDQAASAGESATTSTNYLQSEEVVYVRISTSTNPKTDTATSSYEMLPVEPVLFEYIEVTGGCGPHFQGECLNVRSGPGTEYDVQGQLRNGMVLRVGGRVARDGQMWYKIIFDEWLRYPERLKGDWYVASNFVEVLYDEGDKTIWDDGAPTSTEKKIFVSRSKQTLQAYENDVLVLETAVSTGLEMTPTPRGTFSIFKKTPSRYMQGPLPNLADKQVYDLPGVPWNLYFTQGGAVIHGAYWHESFGTKYSHGCVNLPTNIAETLYNWAELGTEVVVID